MREGFCGYAMIKAMDKNKKGFSTLAVIVVLVIVLVFIAGVWYYETRQTTSPQSSGVSLGVAATTTLPSSTATSSAPAGQGTTASTSVVYQNSQYGFDFLLPADWQGYSIVNKTWSGSGTSEQGIIATGTELLIRNPNWTAADHYEDIPVMVFTLAQWNAYDGGNGTFEISAAPLPASEMGRNNRYVFAIPPRWDFDYSTGYQEADAIVSGNPLKPFGL